MLKFVTALQGGGNLYIFGLTQANLNRLRFNQEPIFFDFGYTNLPHLFGLILYFDEFQEPAEITANADAVRERCLPFINESRGVTGGALRVFPLAKSIMEKLENTPFWSFDALLEITHANDIQLFFSGRTEQEMEQFFEKQGLITPKTKRLYKGFGKRDT